MKKSITSNPKLKYFTFSSQKKFNFKKALICSRRSGAQTSGTDVKRSRTGRRSVRVPRRIPRKGGVRASITPNIRVLCYPLSPRYLQAFPTSYSFPLPCVRVEKHEHLKDLYKYLCKM